MKGGILMRKKKLVTMIAALALTICSATMGALPVNAAENDDVKVMDFVNKDVFQMVRKHSTNMMKMPQI